MDRKELDRLYKRIEKVSGITRYLRILRFRSICRSLFL